ncbi:DUF418 domain-containing protein [Streptomyces caelestis]|jgi:uncharacterized membrane protein YeiB|nr:DUF418 domain-containing protein [Streptomyces caelestis]GGW49621.1 hypothetical protein GCM10010320_32600 [Streptomyces caelestis]
MTFSTDAANTTPKGGAVAPGRRSLAPDLARGVMLLVIAVVHAHMYVQADDYLPLGYPTEGGLLDRAVAGVVTVMGDTRGYPMFAALFGYGVAQIHRRQQAAGREWHDIRRLLRQRGRWLVVFGGCHAVLLYSGDILAAYGLIALLFAGMLRFRDRSLLVAAGVLCLISTTLFSLIAASAGMDGGASTVVSTTENPLRDALNRATGWPGSTLMLVFISVGPFLLGVWAARRRVLEEPGRHQRFLRNTAAIGIGAAIAGGLPLALITSLVWTDPSQATLGLAGVLHMAGGVGGGLGYAALIGLLAVRVGEQRGPLVTALSACGQRSMTCYLLQSVAWLGLFAPYTLNLGRHLGVAGTVLVGVIVWACSVLIADVLRRKNRRGPAETALRRLTYGPSRERSPVQKAS